MNNSKKASFILLPVLVLGMLALACGFGAEPTPPLVDTPSPADPATPITPTAAALPQGMQTYTNRVWGLQLDYPADWEAEAEGSGVIFATGSEFDPEDEEGAALAVFFDAPTSAEIRTVEELWADMAAEAEAEVGEPEPVTIGGVNAWQGALQGTGESFYGRLIVAVANGYGYVFVLAVNPQGMWGEYEPVFRTMLDTVSFSPPVVAPGAVTSRDDIPTPADADMLVDLAHVIGYTTDMSVLDTANFLATSLPEYGWEAQIDHILYSISEEESLLFFARDGETAIVAVSTEESSGRTQVSILIGEQ